MAELSRQQIHGGCAAEPRAALLQYGNHQRAVAARSAGLRLIVVEQSEYVRRLLEAYRATPGTAGVVRRPDRLFAAQLHERGVPLETVENALILAAARRSVRRADAPPLGIIRSMAYFSPVIEEVLQLKVGQEYFQHLRSKLRRTTKAG